MRLALWISRHLRLSDGGRGPSRSGVVIAVSGIALAVTVMLLSVAVVVGFKQAITGKVAGFMPSVSVAPEEGYRKDPLLSGDSLAAALDAQTRYVRHLMDSLSPGGAKVSAVMRRPGILKTDTDFLGVEFTAFSAEHDTLFEASLLTAGRLPREANEIALSSLQASKLGLAVGDRVYAYFISDGAVRTRRPTITGIFRSNFGEYDRSLAYMSAELAESLAGTGTDALEIRGLKDANQLAMELQRRLVDAYHSDKTIDAWGVLTIGQQGAAYFNWLELLDTNVVVILILMGFVSGFTLISSLIILILERVRMIGILKSLGATNRQVRDVFLFLGARIVFLGLLIGNAVALALVAAEHAWHFIPLDASAYYLDHVPVALKLWQVAALDAGVVVAAMAVMLLPAMIISRISPSNVMRYE